MTAPRPRASLVAIVLPAAAAPATSPGALAGQAGTAASAAAGRDGAGPFARFPAVSPDGRTVAFSHQGDLFRGPVEGGPAARLTVHEAHESRPGRS